MSLDPKEKEARLKVNDDIFADLAQSVRGIA
jgi:hypothetical protein